MSKFMDSCHTDATQEYQLGGVPKSLVLGVPGEVETAENEITMEGLKYTTYLK